MYAVWRAGKDVDAASSLGLAIEGERGDMLVGVALLGGFFGALRGSAVGDPLPECFWNCESNSLRAESESDSHCPCLFPFAGYIAIVPQLSKRNNFGRPKLD